MSDSNFADFIAKEHDRLNGEREQLINQRREIDQKLHAIDQEFAAIQAYQSAKTGKQARGAGTGAGQRRPRGESKRGELLRIISEGHGLVRKEILDRMGLKGDKAGEMSVSNALTALTKANTVRRDGGKYHSA